MFEVLCAVLVITVIGLTWHIWRPILIWAGVAAAVLAVVGGAAGAIVAIWQNFDSLRPLVFLGMFLFGVVAFFSSSDWLLKRLGLAERAMRLHEAAPWFFGLTAVAILLGVVGLLIFLGTEQGTPGKSAANGPWEKYQPVSGNRPPAGQR
jgi:small basic protein